MITLFIVLQIILLFFMLFHDWIPVPPFNNIPALKLADSNWYRLMGSCINGTTVLVPLILTLIYYFRSPIPLSASITVTAFYLLITVGTLLSWWVPYLFGSSPQHKQQFKKFKKTHHFLPPRGDHVVPNTLHVVLHLQVWVC
ncbi:MAG: hypothetical protein JSR80_05875, partial [Verrucomicrobia bacterium]|nr:hypothetical protein [Verrucomicrobiota bacterium]